MWTPLDFYLLPLIWMDMWAGLYMQTYGPWIEFFEVTPE